MTTTKRIIKLLYLFIFHLDINCFSCGRLHVARPYYYYTFSDSGWNDVDSTECRTVDNGKVTDIGVVNHVVHRIVVDSVVDDNCTVLEYNKLIEIGEFVNSRHKGRNYNAYQKVHKAMVTKTNNNPNFTGKDLLLYEDLLEYRRNLAIEKKMPLCNIFLNREAEQMVLLKPKNAEELMSIPGIKTKKFLLFGEDVLAIIKKYL